ncbi:C-5 sterol desaturase [Deinococcus arenae]|uniref:C-5 sterol desaturase n=1 Tax=Deinococcus arenae TaxID=1452751 RepID=A0A8H9GI78_9DEIO|nr:sterol desaturase family protein [Deinococcus arenae]AWT36128.1 C-5 sterol desaturase [Deinococcus actinosclerus]GGM28934.1 C-5 sterol desaturase [Deinococcus arenae]
MFDLIRAAIPVFLLSLLIEWAAYRHLSHDHDAPHEHYGYEVRDTLTSLSMGIGNVLINLLWKGVVVTLYAALYSLTPLRLPRDAWWVWALLFLADDYAYYWYHRVSHEVRLFWASHVVHHSSQHYNLSTALRQTWVPMTALPFWLLLPLLGFAPWMVLLAQAWNLLYQFFVHTERVGRLPAPIEYMLNTPSHHRAHHGSNDVYLDRNYGGILIVWDRLHRTFQPETEPVRYGLVHNIHTHRPAQVAFHEFAALWRDVRAARSWRDRLHYLTRPPGWHPER